MLRSNFLVPYKQAFYTLLLFISSLFAAAQSVPVVQNYTTPSEILKLNELLLNHQISDTLYLRDFKLLTDQFFHQGRKFAVKELENHLSLYKQLAWKQKSPNQYKQQYYLILLNNAYLNQKRSASIYYAEKLALEAQKDNIKRSLIRLSVKTDLFAWQQRTDNIIAMLKENEQYLITEYSHIMKEPQKNPIQALDALNLLGKMYQAYAVNNDTVRTKKIYNAAHKLYCTITWDTLVDKSVQVDLEYAMRSIDYHQAIMYKDYTQAEQLLERLSTLQQGDNFPNQYHLTSNEIIKQTLLNWQSTLYLHLKDADKASFYISKYDSLPTISLFKEARTYAHKANLAMLEQDYKQAYNFTLLANGTYKEITVDLIKEMDNFLRSDLTSEARLQAFVQSEKQKTQAIVIFGSIILVLLAIAYWIYKRMSTKEQALQSKISQLTASSTIQIAVLEQLAQQARHQEKEKISQNLHDNLAGLLAAIHNRIELACVEKNTQEDQQWLEELRHLTQVAYQEVRQQSHQLYQQATTTEQHLFINHIENLVKIAFPSPHYQVQIDIDPLAIQDTSMEIQTQLIRVIQELFTNIIKHAKATKVDLLLYKENNLLHLFIEDNGIGFEKKAPKNKSTTASMGLESINKRLAQLGSTLEISTTKGKTELHICIVLQQ